MYVSSWHISVGKCETIEYYDHMNIETNDSLLFRLSETFDTQQLPKGVPKSMGMVATYRPKDLRLAINQAHQRHDAYVASSRKTTEKFSLTDALGALQNEFEEQLSAGEVPTADALEAVFNSPKVSDIEVARRRQQLKESQRIAKDHALALQLDDNIRQLSRRSRLWGAILGLSLGTVSTFGVLQAVSVNEEAGQQTEQAVEARADAINYAFYGSAMMTVAFGVAGSFAGKHAKGFIAQRGARHLVQQARKR